MELGKCLATRSGGGNLRLQTCSDGLDAAEEPPAWKQFRLKRCPLNHVSVVCDNKRRTESAIAMIGFQNINPPEMLL